MVQPENYQIIARKYRPQTFADVVGQDSVVTTLKNALASKKLAHAYLFSGSRGTGKTTLARLLAKALNCTSFNETVEPCNSCRSCREITSGHSLSVIEIDGASNRGIDDIRQINETVAFTPPSGSYKIYIIDEVHMLTREAFNALLKTLEEPPPNVKFFFATTEPHKVLPTIISRCQRFDLKRISQEEIEQKLTDIARDLNVEIERDALRLIAQSAEGGLRDAESLLDQVACSFPSPIQTEAVASMLGTLSKELFFELDKAIAGHDLSFAANLANRIFSEGKDFGYVLESLLEHYRTLLYLTLPGQQPPQWMSASELHTYREASKLYTQEQCLSLIDLLMDALQHMTKLSFKRVHLEMIFLRMIRSKHLVTIDTLTHKLTELQAKLGNIAPEPPKQEAPSPPPQQKLTEALVPPRAREASALPPSSQPEEPKKPTKHKSHYDTVVRFAAIELEGSVKPLLKI